ncbi:RRM elav [Sarracenia purpurea var. burkii]
MARERKFGGSGGETIFIHDLSKKMDQRWLGNIFSKNWKVLNVFIPQRMRLSSNTRFEFVTFSSHRGAALAIARYNGIWCLGRRLQVSKARFNPKKVTRIQDLGSI